MARLTVHNTVYRIPCTTASIHMKRGPRAARQPKTLAETVRVRAEQFQLDYIKRRTVFRIFKINTFRREFNANSVFESISSKSWDMKHRLTVKSADKPHNSTPADV